MSLTSGLFDTIRGFLEPRSLEVRSYVGQDGGRIMVEFGNIPRVIEVADKAMYQWDPEAPSLEELGYRKYANQIVSRTSLYARRPWVYLIRGALWLRARCWWLMRLTYARLWHVDPWVGFYGLKWRNIRPGPGAAARARADVADLRIQIDAQHKEIEYLKLEKDVSYDAGVDAGWRQHAQVVERYIDDMQKTKD